MRAEGVLRVILNASLYVGMTCLEDGKHVRTTVFEGKERRHITFRVGAELIPGHWCRRAGKHGLTLGTDCVAKGRCRALCYHLRAHAARVAQDGVARGAPGSRQRGVSGPRLLFGTLYTSLSLLHSSFILTILLLPAHSLSLSLSSTTLPPILRPARTRNTHTRGPVARPVDSASQFRIIHPTHTNISPHHYPSRVMCAMGQLDSPVQSIWCIPFPFPSPSPSCPPPLSPTPSRPRLSSRRPTPHSSLTQSVICIRVRLNIGDTGGIRGQAGGDKGVWGDKGLAGSWAMVYGLWATTMGDGRALSVYRRVANRRVMRLMALACAVGWCRGAFLRLRVREMGHSTC